MIVVHWKVHWASASWRANEIRRRVHENNPEIVCLDGGEDQWQVDEGAPLGRYRTIPGAREQDHKKIAALTVDFSRFVRQR